MSQNKTYRPLFALLLISFCNANEAISEPKDDQIFELSTFGSYQRANSPVKIDGVNIDYEFGAIGAGVKFHPTTNLTVFGKYGTGQAEDQNVYIGRHQFIGDITGQYTEIGATYAFKIPRKDLTLAATVASSKRKFNADTLIHTDPSSSFVGFSTAALDSTEIAISLVKKTQSSISISAAAGFWDWTFSSNGEAQNSSGLKIKKNLHATSQDPFISIAVQRSIHGHSVDASYSLRRMSADEVANIHEVSLSAIWKF